MTEVNPADRTAASTEPAGGRTNLARALTTRHIQFIALGTSIGTGLFMGSSGAIQLAGPAVLLAYLAAGIAVFMVMRALGEMALREPMAIGSISRYAHEYLSPQIGFMVGWLFIIELLVVAMADVTAFAAYLERWFPGVPLWVWIVAAIASVTLLNMVHVKVFGETEFWLSLIKVVAVIAMIVAGVAIMLFQFGMPAGETAGVHHLWEHGGFMPHGPMGVLLSLTIVVFAFGGIETLAVASMEAEDPERAVPRAINTIPWRILIFYLGSVGVLLCLAPWDSIDGSTSSFVQIFDTIGLPGAADVLNFIVISAAFSGLNAVTFSIGRMLHGLAELGDAPRSFARTSGRGTPVMAILMVAVAVSFVLVLNQLIPEDMFAAIASVASFAVVFTWLMFLLSHISMRRRIARGELEPGTFNSPAGMIGSICAAVFVLVLLVMLAIEPQSQMAVMVGGVTTVILLALGFVVRGMRGRRLANDSRCAD
ncbi:amino acid permease [Gulosibacter bifidus]|uniref:Amino acid permease n=1 Tax=Gulosibacter bifidus TaxID=272239 RepID=A0ABW5RME5_9MICO|nr:amino acid permease [Gulosibacter bifidus]